MLLYSFKRGLDGQYPVADLIAVDGKLYGTTAYGGTSSNGTVFTMSTTGEEHVLYSFQGGTDGQFPMAGLITVSGTLYGTTEDGGGSSACGSSGSLHGCGTVFALSTSGKERVLYSFQGPPDAIEPEAGLTAIKGQLYGTTSGGGAFNAGAVFDVGTSGGEHLLHQFRGGKSGQAPYADVIDVNGTLYGTTPFITGTVFGVNTTGNGYRLLYRFKGGTDGGSPFAGLTDVSGTLYGTTEGGGVKACGPTSSGGYYGCGTIFAVSTSGDEHVVYGFKGGTDGRTPAAGLIAVNGMLYGTTFYGGGLGCLSGFG